MTIGTLGGKAPPPLIQEYFASHMDILESHILDSKNPVDNLEIVNRGYFVRLINNMISKNDKGRYHPFDHRPPETAKFHRK